MTGRGAWGWSEGVHTLRDRQSSLVSSTGSPFWKSTWGQLAPKRVASRGVFHGSAGSGGRPGRGPGGGAAGGGGSRGGEGPGAAGGGGRGGGRREGDAEEGGTAVLIREALDRAS